MVRKQEKSREEKTAESFFPVDKHFKLKTEKEIPKETPQEDFLKHSVEKKVKENLPQETLSKKTIKKEYKKPSQKYLEKISRKKTKNKRTTTKEINFTIPKINLKEKGYELIITEKPQAAAKISSALGKTIRRDSKGVSFYEVQRDTKKIIVACAVGHLFTLKQKNKGSEIPSFEISWVPNYLARKGDFTKKYYDTLSKLVKDAGTLTVATDFDVEGELIGLNIVRFIAGQKDAQRMKFSTLTETELNKAYENKLPNIKWDQAIAGETRHYLDWFYGINLSRALMNAIKTTGRFKIMSIGRVQGPTLNLIVKKEKEIQDFKSKPYWQIFITIDDEKNQLELKHNKDLFEKTELKNFENLVGQKTIAQTKKSQQILPPNPPFNLTTLQTESYKFYGITPSNTLKAAQSLYLAGLISYPRTSSQKLPKEIDYKKILDILKIRFKVAKLITKENPIEGKKTDPAHPSIYPTGNKPPILSGDEEKIYNLIVKRFLSLFCDDAIVDNKKISVNINNFEFSTRGSEIKKKSWMEIYPTKLKENQIPDMEGEVKIIDSRIEEKQTQPPNRYSPASIITQLEKRNLGTKATRSSILETLYDRGYIKEKSIEATPIGISLINTLEKYSPIIIDEKLTRSFEDSMQSITDSHKDFEGKNKNLNESLKKIEQKKEKIIEKAKTTIIKISEEFKKNENRIGESLVNASTKYIEEQKKENTLTLCPLCKKGNLIITYSKKTRRYFVGCDSYPECKNTYSLPPNGIIKKTEKICEFCSFPKLIRLSKGKRPWEFCFNPQCETNKEWIKKREERKSQ